MTTTRDRIRAGLFLTVSAAMFLGLVGALLGWQRLASEADYYEAHFEESVSGLERGSTVRYNGVPVGSVKEIAFLPENPKVIVVSMLLRRGTPVKRDTAAVLKPQGVTGQFSVELVGGSSEASHLPPGDRIPTKRSVLLALADAVDRIREMSERVNRFLDENAGTLASTLGLFRDNLAELRGTMTEVRALLRDNRETVHASLASVGVAAEEARRLLTAPGTQALAERLGRAADAVDRSLHDQSVDGSVAQAARAITDACATLERSMGRGGSGLEATLVELQAVARNLKELSALLARRPDALLRGGSAKEKP
jgi:phospholipid/cholesterol/gamma-HCH transport system substrate-binding protein